MAPLELTLTYATREQLAAHLAQAAEGALLVPLEQPDQAAQFQPATLHFVVGEPQRGAQAEVDGEVLQAIPSLGVVVRLTDVAAVEELATGAAPAPTAEPPTVTPGAPPQRPKHAAGAAMRAISWPIEKLQAQWNELGKPERIQVAKYGKRPARGMIIRMQDKMLINFVLSNPRIGADEVAVVAGSSATEPSVLRRIAANHEWLRSTAVVRNLVCHPKMALTDVNKLLRKLPEAELRRLAKGGKVRAAVKRTIIKIIDRGR